MLTDCGGSGTRLMLGIHNREEREIERGRERDHLHYGQEEHRGSGEVTSSRMSCVKGPVRSLL